MQSFRNIFFIIISIFVITFPHFADARAGGGRSSMGSRGTRTYSAPSAPSVQPIQRSTTAQPSQQPGAIPSGVNQGQPIDVMANSGGSSFWRGVGGGFLGAGIGSMLFGHGGGYGYGGGYGGMGGGGIGLFPILLIGIFVYFGVRAFRNSSSNGRSSMGNIFPANFSNNNSYVAPEVTQPLNITDGDKDYFEQLLIKIQHNWSEGDLTRLRQFVTPEMLQYFSEELSSNASRGLANKVQNVKLENADITESWHEFDLDYASANLQWSAVDYMVHLDKNAGDKDYIASGSDTEAETAQELWTFVRASGGNWLLSAIQQVG